MTFYSPWLHLQLLQCSLLILTFTIVTLYQKQNRKAKVDTFALLAFYEYFILKIYHLTRCYIKGIKCQIMLASKIWDKVNT